MSVFYFFNPSHFSFFLRRYDFSPPSQKLNLPFIQCVSVCCKPLRKCGKKKLGRLDGKKVTRETKTGEERESRKKLFLTGDDVGIFTFIPLLDSINLAGDTLGKQKRSAVAGPMGFSFAVFFFMFQLLFFIV